MNLIHHPVSDNSHHDTRSLATLRMPSEDDDNVTATTAADEGISSRYDSPTAIVTALHHAPRFGYSAHLGLIASPDPMVYAGGIKQFTLFYLIVPFVIWAVVLLAFKFCYTSRRVGCAAGGEVLDMYHMSKELHLTRKQRKRRVLRSWKVQSVFLISSIGIPIVSIVMMTVGLTTLTTSVVEVQEWVGDVETLAFRGWTALDALKKTQQELFTRNTNGTLQSNNELVQGFLDFHQNEPTSTTSAQKEELDKFMEHHNGHPNQINVTIDGNVIYTTPGSPASPSDFVRTWCPNAANASISELDVFFRAMDTIQGDTKDMMEVLEMFGSSSTTHATIDSSFQAVTQTTQAVDSTLEWFLQNDWMLKMLILCLNVVSFGLFLNVFLLSKNNVIHPPTRFYMSWILVPLFVVLLSAILGITMLLGISALINGDFCSGGAVNEVGSVQGTLEDALLAYFENGDLSRQSLLMKNVSITSLQQARSTPPLIMASASIDYYASGCLSTNPLEFLDVISSQLDSAAAQINHLVSVVAPTENFDGASTHTELLNKECGRDMSFLLPSLRDLNDRIGQLSSNLGKITEDVVGCHQISPLYQRLTRGAMCHETPYGLTVLWICAVTLCILGFVMLTTRAALYNSVKRKKPREKKPRRVVEKEFDSYKDYMKDYYDDVERWQLDEPLPSEYGDAVLAIKATKIALEFENGLDTKSTFETASSSNQSTTGSNENAHSRPESSIRQRQQQTKSRGDSSLDIGRIHHHHQSAMESNDIGEESSCGSSYESEISDDSLNDSKEGKSFEENDDEQSAIVSFISETRSMAMQTIHSLQNLKPIMRSIVPPGLLPSPKEEEEIIDDDDFLFQDKDIGMDRSDRPEDDVEYLGESTCRPSATPGLQPAPPMPKVQRDKDGDDGDIAGYANHYIAKKKTQQSSPDGVIQINTSSKLKSSSWFGRSVRHQSSKKRSTKAHSPPRVLEALTPSSIMSALTPMAPNKPFSFLSRAKKSETNCLLNDTDYDDHAFFEDGDANDDQICTPGVRRRHGTKHSPSTFSFSPGMDFSIQPQKLEMSPLLVSSHNKQIKTSKNHYVSTRQAKRRLDFQKDDSELEHESLPSRHDVPTTNAKSMLPITTPSKTTMFSAPYVQELVSRYNKKDDRIQSHATRTTMGIAEPKASRTVLGSSARRHKASSSWTKTSNTNTR